MKVAIRVPNWLGDAVMALPAIDAVAMQAEVALIAHPAVAALYRHHRVIETKQGAVAAIKEAQPDRIILLTNSFGSALTAVMAGVPERIGYRDHFRSMLLTQSFRRNRKNHQIDEYNSLVENAGYKTPERIPKLRMTGGHSGIVLAPGAKYGSAKCWTGFSELARRLSDRGEKISVIGARGEQFAAPPGVENLVGKTSLAEALEIVSNARVVVSNDSGIAHVAAALGKRTIVIFGPTDPSCTAPRGAEIVRGIAACAPCGLRQCPIDHRCMESISAEEVLKLV